jgi:hypothetical protein
MKRQTRPFIVEVKHKRGARKPRRSIWGGLDLSAIAAETGNEEQQPSDSQLVDSKVTVVDANSQHNSRAEQHMPDPQEVESAQTGVEAPAKLTAVEPKKRTTRPRKAKAEAGQPTVRKSPRQSAKATEASAPATQATRKTYSQKERAQKLSQIEKSIAGGATTKNAVGQAGISEQTYYQWKKAAAPSFESGDLKDLLSLEEENKRLKKMLAERLRKENAELKNKLGLA